MIIGNALISNEKEDVDLMQQLKLALDYVVCIVRLEK